VKRKRFSVEQIVGVLKQAEVGVPVAVLIRQAGHLGHASGFSCSCLSCRNGSVSNPCYCFFQQYSFWCRAESEQFIRRHRGVYE
jgi:hypothetical protein